MNTLVRSVALNGFLNVCNHHGLRAQDLLRKVGLDAGPLIDKDRHISIESLCCLLELASQESACSSFGVQMAQHRQMLDFGILGNLMRHKQCLRDILQTAIHYRKLLNDALGIWLEPLGDLTIVRFELLTDVKAPQTQACELAAGVVMRTCQAVLGIAWKPHSVNFVHPAPQEISKHKNFFGCAINFNNEFHGLVLRTSDLNTPNSSADPELVRYAENVAMPLMDLGDNPILNEVRKSIYLLLPLEQARVERVAEQMHLSPRTLQRQLEQCGTSFSQLQDEVRKTLVQRHLSNSHHTIGQVASLAGYSRQASFTRWFQLNFGMSPRQWRRGNFV